MNLQHVTDDIIGRGLDDYEATNIESWHGTADELVKLCHPKQRAFVLDPGRRIAALCGRGAGKSTGGMVRLLRRLLTTPDAKTLFICTTRQHAKELLWEKLKEITDKTGVGGRFAETALKLTLPRNNAQLRLVGADDAREIEKLRGLPHHEVGIDEGASHKPLLLKHLIHRIIAPRLGDYNGTLWMVGTPSHILHGPFYDVTRPGSDMSRLWTDRNLPEYAEWKRWSFHKWTLRDGAPHIPAMQRLWDEALVTLEAEYGGDENHPTFRREYLGEWAADDSERIYRYFPHDEDGDELAQWDPPRHPNGFAKLEGTGWNFVYGIDFGWADDFAIEVFAFRDNEKRLYHVGEVAQKGMYPRKVAELLLGEGLDADRPGGLIGHTGWPVAMVADKSAGGEAIMTELREVYGITIDAADKKNKHDSIELANGDMQQGLIKILRDSRLEEQLVNLQWDIDDWGKLKERRDQPNDCADCMIYARRRAGHLLADDSPAPVVVARASREGQERELEDQERRLLDGPGEFDWLDDDDYGGDW